MDAPARAVLTFDLDGVLCRPPFGVNPGKGQHKRRNGEGRRNLLWMTERWRYLGRKPMPGAVEGFLAFSERFECHVVTARAEVARPLTERWLRRHFGEVPTLHMRPHWREKSAQFKARKVVELGAVAHFEDDPHTARWLAELGPTVFLVDWGRNRWLEGERIHRIHQLPDALPMLDQLQGRARRD